ncbi:MAG: VOC family protein [Chloroflexi bacterium]|nr:VOC family protein [Chloroflexota bacterium]
MAFTRIHHVGIITPSLEEAQKVYCGGFGLAVDRRRSPLPNGRTGSFDSVSTIEVPVAELYLELSKPNDPNTEAGKFLAERPGGGMHHLCLASDDIVNDVRRLQQKGVKIRADQAGKWDGHSPVFLDPATTLGLQLEVASSEQYYPHPAFRGEGLIIGMAHIGIAARNYEEVYKLWADTFGLPQNYSRDRGGPRRQEAGRSIGPDDPVWLKEFPIGGCVLEISIPADTESGTARFVAQRATQGAAFHHIGPYANNVHALVARAKAGGVQQIGAIPEPGQAVNYVAWFHPRSCIGTLVEVWNRPEP